MKPTVSVVIPAFNEEELLPITLENLVGCAWVKELIVVNDGSTDQTGAVAEQYCKKVVHLQTNLGKSQALKQGWKVATSDFVMTLDADLTDSVRGAERLLEYLIEKNLDCVVAKLPTQKRQGFGLMRRRAQKLIFAKTGKWMNAPLSGQRLLKRSWLEPIIKKEYVGFGVEMAMTIDLLKAGAKMEEVEVPFYHRATGKDLNGFVHRIKQWKDMEKTLWRMRSTW